MKIDIDAHELLVQEISKAGGVTKLGEQWGVTPQFISDIARGIRPIPDRFLEKLGVRWTLIPTDK